MNATVYVDGLNLYYSGLRSTPYKWLDIPRLVDLLIPALDPSLQVTVIRYFTARVQPLPQDPDAPARQHMYLRALALDNRLQIHEGFFRTDRRVRTLVTPCATPHCSLASPGNLGTHAVVWQSEEKGSDVNFGAWVMRDCALASVDAVVAITNDSDLAEPLRLVRDEFQKPVYLLNPQRSPHKWTNKLRGVVTAALPINRNALAKCQFPSPLSDANGQIMKPAAW